MDQSPAAPATTGSPLRLLWLLGFLVAGFALHLAIYVPRLPERVATHFNGLGQANGWMTPRGMVNFDLLVLGILLASGLLPVWLVRATGPRYVNLPAKDYWFAPERRAATLDRLTTHLLWFPCLVVAFFLAVNQLVFQANLQSSDPSLDGTWFAILLTLFFVATMTWTVRLLMAFRRPKERDP